MVASDQRLQVERIAQDLFDVLTHIGLAAAARRRPAGMLKEIEYQTLAILHDHGTMVVGHIQRLLGVLPAQMSRVIRSLEDRDRPMIACHINSHDKRKVDVSMTPAGAKALQDYQAARVDRLSAALRELPSDAQEELGQLVERLRDRLKFTPSRNGPSH
jgi:DNA-binding MarR family transcriptional regulator